MYNNEEEEITCMLKDNSWKFQLKFKFQYISLKMVKSHL